MGDIVMMNKGECTNDFTTFMQGAVARPVMQGGHPVPAAIHVCNVHTGNIDMVVEESEHLMPVVMHKFKSDAGENVLVVAESGGSRKCE